MGSGHAELSFLPAHAPHSAFTSPELSLRPAAELSTRDPVRAADVGCCRRTAWRPDNEETAELMQTWEPRGRTPSVTGRLQKRRPAAPPGASSFLILLCFALSTPFAERQRRLSGSARPEPQHPASLHPHAWPPGCTRSGAAEASAPTEWRPLLQWIKNASPLTWHLVPSHLTLQMARGGLLPPLTLIRDEVLPPKSRRHNRSPVLGPSRERQV